MNRLEEVINYFHDESDVAVLLTGARRFAAHIRDMQQRWERGVYGQEEAEHVARLNHIFVSLVTACENEDEVERDAQALLLECAKFTPASDVFVPVTEPSLSQLLDEKYGSPGEYKWCDHGFVHGIDCPEGCKEGTRT
jgi:hypothetical protein